MFDFNINYLSTVGRGVSSFIRKRIAQRQNKVAAPPPIYLTTELGASGSVSPSSIEPHRYFSETYDRREIIREVRKLLAQNPLLAQAADVFVNTAVSKGFTVTVATTSARGVAAGVQRRAQRAFDRFVKDSALQRKIPGWGRMLLAEGDLFIQHIEYKGQLINAKRMPAVTMVRNSDIRDAFPNVLDAFRQIDVANLGIIDRFALWQMSHSRWNWVDGERYGVPQYLQLRSYSKALLQQLGDLVLRRHSRGPGRYHHKIGSPEHPGTEDDVNDYKRLNNLDELQRTGQLGVLMDYFSNGMVDIKEINPDPKLSDIGDIEFLLNFIFPRTGLSKGLIGFGEDINRDVLEQQRQFLYTQQDLLIDALEWGALRPALDLTLLLEDINPDSIIYNIHFEDRMSEEGKLAKLEVLLEVYEAGLMTEEQFVERAAAYLEIRDIAGYVEKLKQQREEKAAKAMEIMQGGSPKAGGQEGGQGGQGGQVTPGDARYKASRSTERAREALADDSRPRRRRGGRGRRRQSSDSPSEGRRRRSDKP